MKKILALALKWMGNRLREPTTYFGLVVAALGYIGVEATNGRVEQIAGAITVLVGVILSIIQERTVADRKGVADSSIPVASGVRDDGEDSGDAVQAVDLTEPSGVSGGAREKFRRRNEQ